MTQEPEITVQEVSMQEWAMVAFHAERAPKRSRLIVRTAPPARTDDAVGGARTAFWVLLATATAGMTWWLL